MAIYCNQVGYLPQAKKMATMTAGKQYRVIRTDGGRHEIVLEAAGEDRGYDATAGDTVVRADFSQITEPGSYHLENELGEVSHTFTISDRVYQPLQRDLLKALYYQRCGCSLEEKYAGIYEHPCCHTGEAMLWEDHSVIREVKGGWHDAGDFGRYISPAAVAVAHLLYAFELFGDSFGEEINIPESGNGVPDVLNECRYELEWMLKMQDEEGGAYHKLTSERHADFIMPQEDKAQFYLFPVSSMATADYAAVMALASRVYKEYDETFAGKLWEAAVSAYGWLEKYPEYRGFHNPETCNTGEYDDDCDLDERLWAAAEMLVTTGQQKYQDTVTKLLQENLTLTEFGWGDVSGLASMAILTDKGRKADIATVTRMHDAVYKEADRLVKLAKETGYGVAMEAEDYLWGSNMIVLNRGMLLLLEAVLIKQSEEPDKEKLAAAYEETALAQLHYLLGNNAVDYSYVTGYGEHAYRNPHNRPTACDGIELPMAGWVSGGPFKTPCDEVGVKEIPKGTPPMKCYLDRVECYSLNEITIYWNSPAVFVAAYFNRR